MKKLFQSQNFFSTLVCIYIYNIIQCRPTCHHSHCLHWVAGNFFFHQNLCHWGRGPGWPVVRDSFLPNPDGKNVILETSRQNLLKFCIRLPITILRTNPYWHFAQKTQKVGQNLSFLVKKWRFFEKIFFQRQLLGTGSPSAKTPS